MRLRHGEQVKSIIFFPHKTFAKGQRVGIVRSIVMSDSGGVQVIKPRLVLRPFDDPKTTTPKYEGLQSIRKEMNCIVVASNKLFLIVEIENENE